MPSHHRCTISQPANGSIVARDVPITLEETDRDGEPAWYGTLNSPQVLLLTAGQKYQLKLDDGRTGTFFVQRNTSAGEAGRAIAIRGVGGLG